MSSSGNSHPQALENLDLLDALRCRIREVTDRADFDRQHLLYSCDELLNNAARDMEADFVAGGNHEESGRIYRILLRAVDHIEWCAYTLKITTVAPSSEGLRRQNQRHCFDFLLMTLQELPYPEGVGRNDDDDHHGLLRESPALSHASDVPLVSSPPAATPASPMSSSQASPASNGEHIVHIKQECISDTLDTDLFDRSHLRKDSRLGSQSQQSPFQEPLPPISTMTMKNEQSSDMPKIWPPISSPNAPSTPPLNLIFSSTSPPGSITTNETTRSTSWEETALMASISPLVRPRMTLEPRDSYLGNQPPNPFQSNRQPNSGPS